VECSLKKHRIVPEFEVEWPEFRLYGLSKVKEKGLMKGLFIVAIIACQSRQIQHLVEDSET